jgi:hypothetical protein
MIRPRQASGGRFPEQPSRSVPLVLFGATRPQDARLASFRRLELDPLPAQRASIRRQVAVQSSRSRISRAPLGSFGTRAEVRRAGAWSDPTVAPESPGPHWVRFASGSHDHKVASKSPSFHWVRFVVAIGFVSSRGSRHHGHPARFVSHWDHMTIKSLQNPHHSIGFVLSWRLASFRKPPPCSHAENVR